MRVLLECDDLRNSLDNYYSLLYLTIRVHRYYYLLPEVVILHFI